MSFSTAFLDHLEECPSMVHVCQCSVVSDRVTVLELNNKSKSKSLTSERYLQQFSASFSVHLANKSTPFGPWSCTVHTQIQKYHGQRKGPIMPVAKRREAGASFVLQPEFEVYYWNECLMSLLTICCVMKLFPLTLHCTTLDRLCRHSQK